MHEATTRLFTASLAQQLVVRVFFGGTVQVKVATPLLLVVAVIELSDVVFAVDSIPAIFGVTTDPFIVYTSNMFAILSLRALYGFVATVVDELEYLQTAVALVLGFIGLKLVGEVQAARPVSRISTSLTLRARPYSPLSVSHLPAAHADGTERAHAGGSERGDFHVSLAGSGGGVAGGRGGGVAAVATAVQVRLAPRCVYMSHKHVHV